MRSSLFARDAFGDDAWNWRDDDWSSFLRVTNRVAQALSCYGEVPDELFEKSKEPSEEDLRIADLAAMTPAARGGGSLEDLDDENADGTADTLEARARMYTPACRALPKVELHAHLNGCVRDQTLLEFARSRGDAPGDGPSTTLASLRETLKREGADGGTRPLKRCFELFGAIHALCTDHSSITRVAAEAVVDFARDGVVYLELRTTPKDFPDKGVTKESYCEAALRGVALGAHVARVILSKRRARRLDKNTRRVDARGDEDRSDAVFFARLILSIDRKETAVEAKRTVRLAAYLRDTDCGVVGVDLSGDPSVGSFAKLEPALKLARANGLPVTLHCGEVVNRGEEAAMLRFKPERLGHCVFTTRDERLWAQLKASKIPIELCITSNVVTDSVEKETKTPPRASGAPDARAAAPSAPTGPANEDAQTAKMSPASAAARHHLMRVHRAGHPFVIATDDPGVFDTSLSREYALAAASCGLRSEDLRFVARNAFEHAFVHAHEAMNEDDAALARAEIEKVRAFLRTGTRAWPGLPAVTAADAILERAAAAKRATKRRIFGAIAEATRRANLIKDAVGDLVDVAAENDAPIGSLLLREDETDVPLAPRRATKRAAMARLARVFLRPGAGDLRADARRAGRFLAELGLLEARAADEADDDAAEAYAALVRGAEATAKTAKTENRETAEPGGGVDEDTLAALRRGGRARRRRAARLARRRARRRVVALASRAARRAFAAALRHAPLAALAAFAARVSCASWLWLARDSAGGTIPTAFSPRALWSTHLACLRAAASFAATGAHGALPTPASAVRLAVSHARLASRAARRVAAAALGSEAAGAVHLPGAAREGACGAASRSDGDCASSAARALASFAGTRQHRPPRRPRHVEVVSAARDASLRDPGLGLGSGDLLRGGRGTPERQ